MFYTFSVFTYGLIIGACLNYIWVLRNTERQQYQRQADLDTGTPIKSQLDREWEEWH